MTDRINQLSVLLEELATQLDVTKTEFENIKTSYRAVGEYLASSDSILAPFKPDIHPQGSFLLGTVVRPISEEDDIDIDLVCELQNKPTWWTQCNLKNAVGDRIKQHETYKAMLDKEGKRCWTLMYATGPYHMDILPSLVGSDYRNEVTRVFNEVNATNLERLAFHITDNTRSDYRVEQNPSKWYATNPFGFAKWFLSIAAEPYRKSSSVMNTRAQISPIPEYNDKKFTLQRVVQLLKRHRDVMFDGDDDKPISIIITTLATRCYSGDTSLYEALSQVSFGLARYVEDRNGIKWVPNPVNPQENFADRWQNNPQKQKNFYKWNEKLCSDIERLRNAQGSGLDNIKKLFSELFGESVSNKTFVRYAENLHTCRDNGILKTASVTGTLGTTGYTAVKAHNFYGKKKNNMDT